MPPPAAAGRKRGEGRGTACGRTACATQSRETDADALPVQFRLARDSLALRLTSEEGRVEGLRRRREGRVEGCLQQQQHQQQQRWRRQRRSEYVFSPSPPLLLPLACSAASTACSAAMRGASGGGAPATGASRPRRRLRRRAWQLDGWGGDNTVRALGGRQGARDCSAHLPLRPCAAAAHPQRDLGFSSPHSSLLLHAAPLRVLPPRPPSPPAAWR